MVNTKFEKKTRSIFHNIHKQQGQDKEIFKRLSTLLNQDYLKVHKNFFKGKICLDAGCGSNANGTYNLLNMGAEKVYAFDLDKSILKVAPKCLSKFKGKYKLSVGNVLKMKYPDNFFDFVHCAGVLHHSKDVYKGLKELARVTKKGGMLYIELYGTGGIVRDITTLLRGKYINDSDFAKTIDNLNEKQLTTSIEWLLESMKAHGDSLANKIPRRMISEMCDRDLVLTIQDRIQAPVYWEDSYEDIEACLKKAGFTKIRRLTKYPRYKNLRRFLSPFYEAYNNRFSKILYGSGQVQLKAIKG